MRAVPRQSICTVHEISSENSLSQKFCWPEVFVSKTLLQFGVHEKWELKQEVIRRPTDMQERLLRRTSSNVIMAVNGLTVNVSVLNVSLSVILSCLRLFTALRLPLAPLSWGSVDYLANVIAK